MSSSRLSNSLRRLALGLFATAVGLVGLGLRAEPTLVATAQAAPPSGAARAKAASDDYDLTQLEVLRKVVVYVKDNYVDPQRVDPREMFVQALEYVEKSTAEVLVEGNAREGRVRVTVGSATQEFEFNDVESIWMIPHRIRPVFAFIQKNLVSTENKRDVEYAAINGMLSTLDPHSWLLKPDVYREMKLQTKGEFGGLGFVISMDEDRLTVKKVLKNTPASRGGIRKGDHIARIEDESTINMDLNEAVSKLRGKPGTEVRIFVRRAKEDEKLHRLTRALISVESVTSQLLSGNVGYVRIASFAGTTARDLAAAVRELKQQSGGKLKGLVLDMRSNPGGLLEQSIQVVDQFVEEGTIVTTAGMSNKLREPKQARADGGERDFPVAVLVNSESASASEIVAGALKNLNRAVIIGRQTFGKGSVQVLYDLPEPMTKNEAALKLTIAQYLTPGDQSIQEIGVTPDIELVPARLSKSRVDLFAPPRLLREADLDKHFSNGFTPATPEASTTVVESGEKPLESLRFLRTEPAAKKDKDSEATPEDEESELADLGEDEPDEERIAQDYQVQFARELVLRAPKTDRLSMLNAARDFVAERRQAEEQKIQKAIEALGLDWAQGQKPAAVGAATVDVTYTPARPAGGDEIQLTATVTNPGQAPLERVRAWTRCDADKEAPQGFCRLLDRREFLFGRIAPGEKRSWTTTIKVPPHMPATHEVVTLLVEDAWGQVTEKPVAVSTIERARPSFAFTYQVLDTDGLALPGETVDVQVDVKNVGTGRSSKKTFVGLRAQGNEKIFMKKGRVSLGEIAPGEMKSATLALEIKPGMDVTKGVPLKVEIGDRDFWEFTSGEIALPSAQTAPQVTEASGTLKVARDVVVSAAPQTGSPPVAQMRAGSRVPVTARVGDWLKVEWARGRPGFVPASTGTIEPGKAPAPASAAKSSALMQRQPPQLSFQGIDPTKGAVVVDGERFRLRGEATDPAGLLDVRVFVDNEKVLYKSAKTERTGAGQKATKIAFDTELQLKPGNNLVLVVAREDEDFTSQRTLIIHRRAPAIADGKAAKVAPAPVAPAPAPAQPK